MTPKMLCLLPAMALALVACDTPEQNVAAGALTGAVLGSAVSSGSDRTRGALVGAAAGIATAAVVNESNRAGQMCRYRNSAGQIYEAPC